MLSGIQSGEGVVGVIQEGRGEKGSNEGLGGVILFGKRAMVRVMVVNWV